jgi:hypothetical protein
MAPRTSNRNRILLTTFGLVVGIATIVTASECTTRSAPRDRMADTGNGGSDVSVHLRDVGVQLHVGAATAAGATRVAGVAGATGGAP